MSLILKDRKTEGEEEEVILVVEVLEGGMGKKNNPNGSVLDRIWGKTLKTVRHLNHKPITCGGA